MIGRDCSSCGAPILFAVNRTTGGKLCIDLEPDPAGNVELWRGDEIAIVHGGRQLEAARKSGAVLYRSHHWTCPHAEEWRKTYQARRPRGRGKPTEGQARLAI